MPEVKNISPIMKICEAKKSFSRNSEEYLNVLDGINLDVASSEFLAVLGLSGCGKSTLLNVLARVEVLDSSCAVG